MQKIVKNEWQQEPEKPYLRAEILRHDVHPEGFDVERIRFMKPGTLKPEQDAGHIVSVLGGECRLYLKDDETKIFHLGTGVHLYIPPGMEVWFDANPSTEFLHVSSLTASQARGKRLLLRDESFIPACAVGTKSLRWIFTPQYLSRRIFLHHDQTLISKSGNPVSWFHTTMFDVLGLPENEDGEPVFKMSYNSRTEFNVCYDVTGKSRVRMAKHPYTASNQAWGPWMTLDGDSTYHLNEAAGGQEEECVTDEKTKKKSYFRNKHEVSILDGHVSLFCMFDPAPMGPERHQPGEYSDYETLSDAFMNEHYQAYQREMTEYDDMVECLSLAKATGTLETYRDTPVWRLYERGRDAQIAIEKELSKTLSAEGVGRERVLAPWMQSVKVS